MKHWGYLSFPDGRGAVPYVQMQARGGRGNAEYWFPTQSECGEENEGGNR